MPVNRSSDIIPRAVRAQVVAEMSTYTLAEIRKLFEVEGFTLPADFELPVSAQRRRTVEAFHGAIDFTAPGDAEAYGRVIGRLFEALADTSERTDHPWSRQARERIERELRRADIELDDRGRLHLPKRIVTSRSLANAPTESGIRLAIPRLERSDAEPEEKVGAAKELVEATIKYALDELAEIYDPKDDIPALAKQLHKRLRLDPKAIAPTTRGADTMVKLLGGLTQIPQGLAELRNEGYGTGHGQAVRISGIKARHADLAARAAIAYATFVLDTLDDPEAPWR